MGFPRVYDNLVEFTSQAVYQWFASLNGTFVRQDDGTLIALFDFLTP
jgi:hypothetical protein